MGGAKGCRMQTSQLKKPLLTRLQLRLAEARFLTFSALIHTVLIVIGGGVVLFQRPPEITDFTANPGSLTAEAVRQFQLPAPPNRQFLHK